MKEISHVCDYRCGKLAAIVASYETEADYRDIYLCSKCIDQAKTWIKNNDSN